MADPLHVLVVESHRGLASVATTALEAAGHEVHRCFGPDDRGFPCLGMQGEPCPIDRGVDVVFLHRAGSTARPTPLEDGVLCALREGVPVVEARPSLVDPFGAHVTAWVDPDDGVVATVEAAASGRYERVAEEVVDTLEPLREAAGLRRDEVGCRIEREGDTLQVTVETARPVEAMAAQALAVRALDAIRVSGLGRGHVGVHVQQAG